MDETSAKAIVCAAIDATRTVMPDYWRACLEQRTTRRSKVLAAAVATSGSRYELTPEGLEAALRAATWRPYAHPALLPGCRAFACDLPGIVGVVEIATLPAGVRFLLADPKGTGAVEATTCGRSAVEWVGYSVIILGPHEGAEVVFTVHPGPPVRPSQLPTADLAGREIGLSEAFALGLRWAKLA